MPDETQEIAPALTAEQWKAQSVPLAFNDRILFTNGGGLEIVSHDDEGYDERTQFIMGDLSIHALMATANAALSDDDPRKITRELVFELRAAASAGDATDEFHFHALERLADILAALLPPE